MLEPRSQGLHVAAAPGGILHHVAGNAARAHARSSAGAAAELHCCDVLVECLPQLLRRYNRLPPVVLEDRQRWWARRASAAHALRPARVEEPTIPPRPSGEAAAAEVEQMPRRQGRVENDILARGGAEEVPRQPAVVDAEDGPDQAAALLHEEVVPHDGEHQEGLAVDQHGLRVADPVQCPTHRVLVRAQAATQLLWPEVVPPALPPVLGAVQPHAGETLDPALLHLRSSWP
mmetsp:Transcript_68352/g.220916  ORF Transcript_68352/g.220916 Transcript_68352/m.220916 type:complete len:232 (-) Transcript_68352:700-1395(-)